jgi:hypothetical protein
MPGPFLGRTPLHRKQQGTSKNRTTACSSHSGSWLVYAWWKLKHGLTPALLYTLEPLPFGLQNFPHVLSVREILLGLLHNHTLYHAPTNRLDITWAQVFEVASKQYWKSQSKKNNAGYICHGKQAMGLVLGICLMWPCLVPLVLWSIKTITEATKEKKTAPM